METVTPETCPHPLCGAGIDGTVAHRYQCNSDRDGTRRGSDCYAREIAALRRQLAEVTAERDRYKADHIEACSLVAKMHAAAVGEVTGPMKGVVEDVEALKADRDELRADNARLRAALEWIHKESVNEAQDSIAKICVDALATHPTRGSRANTEVSRSHE